MACTSGDLTGACSSWVSDWPHLHGRDAQGSLRLGGLFGSHASAAWAGKGYLKLIRVPGWGAGACLGRQHPQSRRSSTPATSSGANGGGVSAPRRRGARVSWRQPGSGVLALRPENKHPDSVNITSIVRKAIASIWVFFSPICEMGTTSPAFSLSPKEVGREPEDLAGRGHHPPRLPLSTCFLVLGIC